MALQGDATGLKVEVDRILRKLETSAAAAESSVSLIRQIDIAKSRMEEACSLLKVPLFLTEPNLALLLKTIKLKSQAELRVVTVNQSQKLNKLLE